MKQLLQGHKIPVHVIKKNSQKYIQEFIREYFKLEYSDDAIHDDILNEIKHVCDRVMSEGRVFDAAPRGAYQRRVQHRFVSDQGLSSLSIGEEPNRRVRVYPSVVSLG